MDLRLSKPEDDIRLASDIAQELCSLALAEEDPALSSGLIARAQVLHKCASDAVTALSNPDECSKKVFTRLRIQIAAASGSRWLPPPPESPPLRIANTRMSPND